MHHGRNVASGFPGQFPSMPQPQQTSPMFSPTSGYNTMAATLGPPGPEAPPSGTDHSRAPDNNAARQCRIGQELVHEIIAKAADVFQLLKCTQLPNHLSTNVNAYQDRKKNLQDSMKMISTYFKRLQQVYASVTDSCDRMDLPPVEEIVPFKDAATVYNQDARKSEAYRKASEEHLMLTQILTNKNAQLKDIIDQLRNLLWEMNMMLSMNNARSQGAMTDN